MTTRTTTTRTTRSIRTMAKKPEPKSGSDGAQAPTRSHPGTISDRQMDDLDARGEKRSGQEHADWTRVHRQAFENRHNN
jgi:hypothetical protein